MRPKKEPNSRPCWLHNRKMGWQSMHVSATRHHSTETALDTRVSTSYSVIAAQAKTQAIAVSTPTAWHPACPCSRGRGQAGSHERAAVASNATHTRNPHAGLGWSNDKREGRQECRAYSAASRAAEEQQRQKWSTPTMEGGKTSRVASVGQCWHGVSSVVLSQPCHQSPHPQWLVVLLQSPSLAISNPRNRKKAFHTPRSRLVAAQNGMQHNTSRGRQKAVRCRGLATQALANSAAQTGPCAANR